MHILLAAATHFEIVPCLEWLQSSFKETAQGFEIGAHRLQIAITGVGMPLTAYRLGSLLAVRRFDFAIQAGVAGVFHDKWPLGTVVEVVSERFGDLGAEMRDGAWSSVHEMRLIDPDAPPFRGGVLYNTRSTPFHFLPKANGLTVNTVSGTHQSIRRLRTSFPDADIENMEGAAFFYACLSTHLPFVSIRALSNYVAPRDKSTWRLDEAIDTLNEVAIQLIQTLAEVP